MSLWEQKAVEFLTYNHFSLTIRENLYHPRGDSEAGLQPLQLGQHIFCNSRSVAEYTVSFVPWQQSVVGKRLSLSHAKGF